MGISKLLPSLAPLMRPFRLAEARGLIAGIDGHVWLHRAIFLDVEASSFGEGTAAHVRYFTTRMKKLQDMGIHPIIIFDGDDLPAKSLTENSRLLQRTTSLARAVSLRDLGNHSRATNHLAMAADVSHNMVNVILRALRDEGFDAVVAPYEADAQLTYLAKTGAIDFVITEDSDLAVYGCPRILFKFDHMNMVAHELARPIWEAPLFNGLSESACMLSCVLAGCDYGPRLNGLGLIRAVQIASRFDSLSNESEASEYLRETLSNRKVEEPESVLAHIKLASLVFKHQTVFDQVSSRLVHLRPISDLALSGIQKYLVGSFYDNITAKQVYEGYLHPISKVSHQFISTRLPSERALGVPPNAELEI